MKKIVGLVMVGTLAYSGSLLATNGMAPIGIGAQSKAMAGAGVALSETSLIGGYNPAGIARVGRRFDSSVSIFNPTRSYTSDSQTVKPFAEEKESKNPLFLIPSVGYSKPIGTRSAWGITMYAKGGGGVAYDNTATFSSIGQAMNNNGHGEGVWTTSEVQQVGLALNYAININDKHSIGLGPVLGFQRFNITGIGYFKDISTSPDHLTDNGWDNSGGIGGAIGWQGRLHKRLTLGAAYHSKMTMTQFKKYRGLFAEGKMDIPAQYIVGATVRPTDRWQISMDYQVIEYSGVPALANPHSESMAIGTPLGSSEDWERILGADDGPGFGWDDVKIFKVGSSYQLGNATTIRAGYSIGNSPIKSEDVLFNILAPAVTEEHASVGLTYRWSKDYQFDFAYVRTFENSVTGNNPNNFVEEDLTLAMDQHDVELGFSMLF
jgi:long-chain fatty acid transport protein